jgi:peroxiredoxin
MLAEGRVSSRRFAGGSLSGVVAASRQVLAMIAAYGKKYWGVERTTFVIDSAGKIARILHKVKPAEHDALVLSALAETSPGVV